MNTFNSFQLTPFTLEGHIDLGQTFGLLKLMKSVDGAIVLVCDDHYGILDQENPTTLPIANTDAGLGFVLDIGIRREKWLTGSGGFYFGMALVQAQSQRVIGQKDFDRDLFETLKSSIDHCYKSGDSHKELAAVRANHLIEAYNTSRLLFPDFYNESYLGLMRIMDSIVDAHGAREFALSTAAVSPELNRSIYDKVSAVSTYAERLNVAETIFNKSLQAAQKTKPRLISQMQSLDDPGHFVYACVYSAYQYRNRFVHHGLPFPDTVKTSIGLEDSGTAYLHPALGTSVLKRYSPKGVAAGDLMDIHDVIPDPKEASEFKESYFQLIPTWHFLKRVVREALLDEVQHL